MVTVGVGVDCFPASISALEWTVENLLNDGDTVILIRVRPKSDHTSESLSEDTGGSPLVPLEEFRQRESEVSIMYGLHFNREVFNVLDDLSDAKEVNVMGIMYWGEPREMLCKAAENLELDSIVVGGGVSGSLKGTCLPSISCSVVANATCPVTVVKAEPDDLADD